MHSKTRVFFDFDNTISKFDVLDDILRRFSTGNHWLKLERDWRARRIGSRKCLEGQVRGLRISREELKRYLKKVTVDPYFKKTLRLLNRNKVPCAILSDNFDFILKEILRHHGIGNIPVFCNRVRFQGRRLIPTFPLFDPSCPHCAHCKGQHLPQNRKITTIYIGDGFSDFCAAKRAGIVFAKATLLKHMRREKRTCLSFKTLKTVYLFFEKFLAGGS